MTVRTVEVSREIAAPRERLFALVADPVAMAVWNPNFEQARWLHGATEAVPDAHFQLHTIDARFDWAVDECEIVEVEPPVRFVFSHVWGERDAALQTYELEPVDDATRVIVRYEVLWEPFITRLRHLIGGDPEDDISRSLHAALEGLRAVAEA